MAEVAIRFAMPAAPLRPYLSTYYEMDITGEGVVRDMLHPEWANIRMTLDARWSFGTAPDRMDDLGGVGIIHGPTSRPTWIEGPPGRAFGIGILPTGWNRFWKADASRFADRYPPLTELMGTETAAFESAIMAASSLEERAAACDAWFMQVLNRSRAKPFDTQVAAFFQVLADPANATVEQITQTLGLPQARLARLAKRGFGFPPKLLLRRQRFLRMLGTLHARPYEEWPDFIDPQYVDQSHMIRDFQRFLGMPPSHYFALERPVLMAATRARAAMFGQPLQGLHLPVKTV